MEKRQNHKKQNKHNNKNKNNQTKDATNARPSSEQSKHVQLSYRARSEVRDLVALLFTTVYEENSNSKEEWCQYLKIQEILQRIQILEAPLHRKREAATNKTSRLANIDKFYQWAKDNGVTYEGLKIKEFPGYDLGLQATRDIKKDEMMFAIPRKLLLSEENLESEFVRDFFKLSNLKLAFALMIESLKPDSFWKPYIDLLPESYSTVLYYSPEEMAQLEGSNALSAALKQCRLIARLYTIIYHMPRVPFPDFKEVFNYDLYSKNGLQKPIYKFDAPWIPKYKNGKIFQFYGWAVSTVMTRENLIPRSGEIPEGEAATTITALIPFWDMANHRRGTITSFYNVVTEQIESTAQDDFKKNEQIFIDYGDRSNAELMIHNGFIIPSNPKDFVAIKLGLSSSDPLSDKRDQLLQLLSIPKTTELKVLPAPVYISSELLAFVRVFNMNEQQLEHWIESERAIDLLHIDCALETALETKTWQYLQTRLMLLLRVFPTTLLEDETLLAVHKELGGKQPKKNYIANMLLEYRVLEKRILEAALDYAKQRTKA